MSKKKILIIDDDPKNIFALAATLRARGYEIISATGVFEGVRSLEKDEEIGVVLLDMMLPEMDGYEALSLIRTDKHLRTLPVIAVTAQAMKGDREKCLDAGANDYISKPIDVDLLLAALRRYIK